MSLLNDFFFLLLSFLSIDMVICSCSRSFQHSIHSSWLQKYLKSLVLIAKNIYINVNWSTKEMSDNSIYFIISFSPLLSLKMPRCLIELFFFLLRIWTLSIRLLEDRKKRREEKSVECHAHIHLSLFICLRWCVKTWLSVIETLAIVIDLALLNFIQKKKFNIICWASGRVEVECYLCFGTKKQCSHTHWLIL